MAAAVQSLSRGAAVMRAGVRTARNAVVMRPQQHQISRRNVAANVSPGPLDAGPIATDSSPQCIEQRAVTCMEPHACASAGRLGRATRAHLSRARARKAGTACSAMLK